jgi:hypothetical protein
MKDKVKGPQEYAKCVGHLHNLQRISGRPCQTAEERAKEQRKIAREKVLGWFSVHFGRLFENACRYVIAIDLHPSLKLRASISHKTYHSFAHSKAARRLEGSKKAALRFQTVLG